MNRIEAKNLLPGQDFIYNYAGGNRTVYRAESVRSGGGRTVITYSVDGSSGFSEFHTTSLSTLVLV